jgi:hypothetical protein
MNRSEPRPEITAPCWRRPAAWRPVALLCVLAALAVPAVPPGAAEETAEEKKEAGEPAGRPSGSGESVDEEAADRKAPSEAEPPRRGPRTAPAAGGRPAPPGSPVAPAPKPPAPPPLRFTDEDLEKYRRPAALEEPGEEREASAGDHPEPATAEAAAPPKAAAPVRPGRILTRPPLRQPPSPDPLKTFKDREAMEKFRADQIRALRDRVRQLEGRLEYLKHKQRAIASGLSPPLPPPQGEEDKAKDASLKVSDLLKDIEAELKALEPELETAREDLVQAELRFGTGAGIP